MPKLDYKTKLLLSRDKKKIYAFYKYNNNIGYIPADISITQRGKTYTTAALMTMIVNVHGIKRIPASSFTIESWFIKNNINIKQFISYYQLLSEVSIGR
jgi:hypothetical protein